MNHLYKENTKGISDKELLLMLKESLKDKINTLKKVLIVPPDITRKNSEAGKITQMYYSILNNHCDIDIIPALGTHEKMTFEEINEMYGNIPKNTFIEHDWKNEVKDIGVIPGDYVEKVSEGIMNDSIKVQINKRLINNSYDLILSIGQVVPHEVVGMANYSKNILVGLGGNDMINKSHMLGAFYGMEKIMGKDFSPVRKVFDYAQEKYLDSLPLVYVLTVTSKINNINTINGLYIGNERKLFEMAVKMSQKLNINYLDRYANKIVVNLDPEEFKSTWLGNKAVYRTKLAIKKGGELIILAKGVNKFGEDKENDKFIRKYGYIGRKKVLELYQEKNTDMMNNLSVAAHLIHGSSDGNFKITYCTEKLSEKEIQSVNYNWESYQNAILKYDINNLKNGWNTLENGEEIFYIDNPALGLWIKM